MSNANLIKVVNIYNNELEFEEVVNGYCCNWEYHVISLHVTLIDTTSNIMYTAFLGKRDV